MKAKLLPVLVATAHAIFRPILAAALPIAIVQAGLLSIPLPYAQFLGSAIPLIAILLAPAMVVLDLTIRLLTELLCLSSALLTARSAAVGMSIPVMEQLPRLSATLAAAENATT